MMGMEVVEGWEMGAKVAEGEVVSEGLLVAGGSAA